MLEKANIKIITASEINPAYLSQDMPGWSRKSHDSFGEKNTLKELERHQKLYHDILKGTLKANTESANEISVEAGEALLFTSVNDGSSFYFHPVIVYKTEAGYNCMGGDIVKFYIAKKNNLNLLVYEKHNV